MLKLGDPLPGVISLLGQPLDLGSICGCPLRLLLELLLELLNLRLELPASGVKLAALSGERLCVAKLLLELMELLPSLLQLFVLLGLVLRDRDQATKLGELLVASHELRPQALSLAIGGGVVRSKLPGKILDLRLHIGGDRLKQLNEAGEAVIERVELLRKKVTKISVFHD